MTVFGTPCHNLKKKCLQKSSIFANVVLYYWKRVIYFSILEKIETVIPEYSPIIYGRKNEVNEVILGQSIFF